ncbi:MAG: hypothetical protein ACX93O_15655 [Flagellimonas sp.]
MELVSKREKNEEQEKKNQDRCTVGYKDGLQDAIKYPFNLKHQWNNNKITK